MFRLKYDNSGVVFTGLVLEGFLYGLYSGTFAMYLKIQASKKDSDKFQNIILYAISILYALSVVLFVCDIGLPIYALLGKPLDSEVLHIDFMVETSLAICDFIAQFILIYRCWIVWGCNFRVVVIPAEAISIRILRYLASKWLLSDLQSINATKGDQILAASGGNKLRSVISVLIESGMALFSIQVAWLVVTIVGTDTVASAVIHYIYDMLIGLAPTIILVRTSLGLSFHDEKSMEEVTIGSLRFASDHPNSVPETGSIGIAGQDSRDDDDIEVRRSNDIDGNVVE